MDKSNLDSSTTARAVAKLHNWQRPRPCWCTGYWFPHRTGGGACEHSATRDIHMAIRHGDVEALADARLAYAFTHGKATNEPCPF